MNGEWAKVVVQTDQKLTNADKFTQNILYYRKE